MDTAPVSVTPRGRVWADLVGQKDAIAIFSKAAQAARSIVAAQNHREAPSPAWQTAMTHSWLIVGPPGSGRSEAAKAFAAALQCTDPDTPGCGVCQACLHTKNGTHPDVTVMKTELVQIKVEQVKDLIQEAYVRPHGENWRVIIVEDYDRVTTQSSNVLLKALEEPPPRTVWLLCAPSVMDVLPTIRSRCRQVHLSLPSREAVAELLVRRDGIDPLLATQVAGEANCHVGRAKGLAQNPQIRQHRNEMLRLVVEMRTPAEAIWVAAALAGLVAQDAGVRAEKEAADEQQKLLAQYGIDGDTPESQIPRTLKSRLRELEKDSKRRARRLDFDQWDRIMEDLAGLYRDVMMLQLGARTPLINESLRDLVEKKANLGAITTAEIRRRAVSRNIARLQSLRQARNRLKQNVNAQLCAEALCLALL